MKCSLTLAEEMFYTVRFVSENVYKFLNDFYITLQNEWQRQWEQRYVRVSEIHMKEALDSGTFAFPIQKWGDKLLFFYVDGLDMNQDLGGMIVLKETTSSTYSSIKFVKHSPFFKASQV